MSASALQRARHAAETVCDPELPMLTLAELGILREVAVDGDRVRVDLTPTYTGCPAMHEMRRDVCSRLTAAGFTQVDVRTVLSPPWTTDWITADGRRKLASAGIAPPNPAPARGDGPIPLTLTAPRRLVRCPRCDSLDTEQTAAFSATACKALYRCTACAEPFEYVKEI